MIPSVNSILYMTCQALCVHTSVSSPILLAPKVTPTGGPFGLTHLSAAEIRLGPAGSIGLGDWSRDSPYCWTLGGEEMNVKARNRILKLESRNLFRHLSGLVIKDPYPWNIYRTFGIPAHIVSVLHPVAGVLATLIHERPTRSKSYDSPATASAMPGLGLPALLGVFSLREYA